MSGTMAGTMAASAMANGPYAENNGCKFTAALSGANEVPGPGAASGTGTSTVSIALPTGGSAQVCYQINVSSLTLPATAAHIHMGATGVAGPVVIPLTAPDASGMASGCVNGVDPTLIQSIFANPAGFYVNVHTSDFPNGAARGQLSGLLVRNLTLHWRLNPASNSSFIVSRARRPAHSFYILETDINDPLFNLDRKGLYGQCLYGFQQFTKFAEPGILAVAIFGHRWRNDRSPFDCTRFDFESSPVQWAHNQSFGVVASVQRCRHMPTAILDRIDSCAMFDDKDIRLLNAKTTRLIFNQIVQ